MNTLDELIAKIGEHAREEVEQWYQAFQEESGSDDIDAFVAYIATKDLPKRPTPFFRSTNPHTLSTDETSEVLHEELKEFGQTISVTGADLQQIDAQQSATFPFFVGKQDLHEVTENIDKGGMGTIYLARQHALGRDVALKQLHPSLNEDPSIVDRFIREAQLTAQLEHPGIVPVHTFIREKDKPPCYTMKVIEGETLKSIISKLSSYLLKTQSTLSPSIQTYLSLDSRLDLFLKICDTISYAHSKGILHRDLKPDNIMIGSYGEIYVVDWGIAKQLNSTEEEQLPQLNPQKQLKLKETHTHIGQMLGTPAYMSPEQAQGKHKELDERSDLFSLGLILYELVFLYPARKTNSPEATAKQATLGGFEDLQLDITGKKPSPVLKAITSKTLRCNPDGRYDNVQQLSDELRRFRRHQEVQAFPENIWRKLLRQANMHQEQVLASLLMIFFSIVGLNIWWLYTKQEHILQTQAQQKIRLARISLANRQAHTLDQTLFRYESILSSFAQTIRTILLHGEVKESTYYLNRSFRPPDLSNSPFYRDQTSFGHVVYKIASGADGAKATQQIKRINSVQSIFQKSMIQSLPFTQQGQPNAALRQQLLTKGYPLLSVFAATRDGVMSLYPGRGSYKASYDPRKRPWFRSAQGRKGLRWSRPYITSQKNHELAIACTRALYDRQGKFLGVVGLDLRLASLRELLLRNQKKMPWARAVLLLRPNGEILLDTRKQYKHSQHKTSLSWSMTLSPLQNVALRQHLKNASKYGYIEYGKASSRKLLIYSRLDSLSWYYVVLTK